MLKIKHCHFKFKFALNCRYDSKGKERENTHKLLLFPRQDYSQINWISVFFIVCP